MKYRLLRILGITAFWRWIHRYHVAVLMLHGVNAPENEQDFEPLRWQMDPEILDGYLRILCDKYEFIDPDTLVEMIAGRQKIRKNCAVITIDDGYLNARHRAMPVLKKYGISPILFIVSGMVDGSRRFWFDRLDCAMQSYAAAGNRTVTFGGREFRLEVDDREQFAAACKALIQFSRTIFADESERVDAIEDLISALVRDVPQPDDTEDGAQMWFDVMDEKEVNAAIREGAEIGSHSHSHFRLNRVPNDVVKFEMLESKKVLERVTGRPCRLFCYPEGGIDEAAKKAAEAAGYAAAFSTKAEPMSLTMPRYAISRIHMPRDVDESELLARICGLSDSLQRTKRFLMSVVKPDAIKIFE